MENGMVVGWNTLKEIEQKLLVAKSRELENRKTIVEQYVNMSLMKQVCSTLFRKTAFFLN